MLWAVCAACMGREAPPDSEIQLGLTLECDTCRIQVYPRVTLGGIEDEAAIQISSAPRVFHQGQYLVAPAGDLAHIARYDSLGHSLPPIGRSGDGPGEYRLIKDLEALPDDSIVVLSQRLTLLTPTLEFGRTIPLSRGVRAFRILALTDGSLVLNNHSVPGQPFVIMDRASNLSRTAGKEVSSDPEQLEHHMTNDNATGFWTARVSGKYLLEHWDNGGLRLHAIEPTSAWFSQAAPEAERPSDPLRVMPQPRITGIWVDSLDHLWVLGIVADEQWEPQNQEVMDPHVEGFVMPDPEDFPNLFDSIIEVINLRSGEIVSTRRYEGVLGGFCCNGSVWEPIADSLGGLKLRIATSSLQYE